MSAAGGQQICISLANTAESVLTSSTLLFAPPKTVSPWTHTLTPNIIDNIFTPNLSPLLFPSSLVYQSSYSMSSQAPDKPPQMESIACAIAQVATDGDKFMNGDHEARKRLVESARQLVTAAETPVESLLWHIWALVRMQLRTCIH